MIAWLLVGMAVPWFATYAFVRRCDSAARHDSAAVCVTRHAGARSGPGPDILHLLCRTAPLRLARPRLLHGGDLRFCRLGAALVADAGEATRSKRPRAARAKTCIAIWQVARHRLPRLAGFRNIGHRRHACRRTARRLRRMEHLDHAGAIPVPFGAKSGAMRSRRSSRIPIIR